MCAVCLHVVDGLDVLQRLAVSLGYVLAEEEEEEANRY